ncbi:Crp/Fnr family transcriptional regulator [Bacteroides thetaiotaomicron]|nr:Crp/Fnr family transcriptional regulator [Bacteroides thetaiotaomicron]
MLISSFIHIKKGEHLVTRGEEVCYLYYLESGIVRLWFSDKENREISARFIQAKEFINFFLSHEEHHAHYNIKALEPCKIWRLPKKIFISYMSYPSISTSWPEYIW